jgi:hypothetical protein
MILHDVRRLALGLGTLAPHPVPRLHRVAGQQSSRPEPARERQDAGSMAKGGTEPRGVSPDNVVLAPKR